MLNARKFNLEDTLYFERGDKGIFKISWKMTDYCPYSCPYCYMSKAVEAARAKDNNPTQDFIEQIASNLDAYVESHAKPTDLIHLHIIGGEVAIFDLKAMLQKINRLDKLILVTNLYRDLEYWRDLKSYCRNRNISFGISASFHIAVLKTAEARQNFCDKLIALNGQMKAVVNNDNLEEYKPYFKQFMERNLAIEITVQRDGENRCCELTPENQAYVDMLRAYQFKRRAAKGLSPYYIVHFKDGTSEGYSSNISLLNNVDGGVLDYSGFYCNAGTNNVRINQNGTMLRSACRLCSGVMLIGNILDKSTWISKDKLKPFICNCYTAKLKSNYYNSPKVLKGCTCFNNCEMWRPGFDTTTRKFDDSVSIAIPNYHEMYKGTSGQLVECMWDHADWPDLDGRDV